MGGMRGDGEGSMLQQTANARHHLRGPSPRDSPQVRLFGGGEYAGCVWGVMRVWEPGEPECRGTGEQG